MGIDAVQKQANASVFISGLGALGMEVSKNLVLSGLKVFTLHDDAVVAPSDLMG
jgi:molybdopterin/thiamine biosynthesis adenylyltransferase